MASFVIGEPGNRLLARIEKSSGDLVLTREEGSQETKIVISKDEKNVLREWLRLDELWPEGLSPDQAEAVVELLRERTA